MTPPLTLAEYALRHRVSYGAVFLWNRAGLLRGAFKAERNGRIVTLVPADAPKPKLIRGAKIPTRPAVRFTAPSPAVRSLAKRMFLRHRRAAKALNITDAIAAQWQEFIPDASEELARIGRANATYDRREWRQYLEVGRQ